MNRRDALIALAALAATPALADATPIPGATRRVLSANGLDFSCFEMGHGPLALCLHGFPDSPFTYRYLLPALAAAGFRAVAPYMRGYAPTSIPADGRFDTGALASDPNALHEALGGGPDAVLVAHDWGAVAAYGALGAAPRRWRRAAIGNVPPWGTLNFTYAQLKRSFYFWLFQMGAAEAFVSADDLAFIGNLWKDWSPAYDARSDVAMAKDALRTPEHLRAALGYYRAFFDPARFGSADWASEQTAAWGRPVDVPVLYLHGTRDGCIAPDAVATERFGDVFRGGHELEHVDGAGHFFLVERPEAVNRRIVGFLKEA